MRFPILSKDKAEALLESLTEEFQAYRRWAIRDEDWERTNRIDGALFALERVSDGLGVRR
jgi:hypothetical protein